MADNVPDAKRLLRSARCLAACAPPALRRRQVTFQEWCEANLSDTVCRELVAAGLWQEFTVSRRYQDDEYEYRHLHIPRGMAARFSPASELLSERSIRVMDPQGLPGLPGTGWEHYMWHHPEKHILLVRRALRAPGGRNGAEAEVQSQPLRVKAETQTPAQAQAAADVLPELGEHAYEQLAVAGLAPSLFLVGAASAHVWASAVELIHKVVGMCEVEEQVVGVTRAAILLRVIRGPAGVHWAVDWLVKDSERVKLLTTTSIATEAVFSTLAYELLRAHDAREEGIKSWASLPEVRHVRFSGRHALVALTKPSGAAGAARLFRGIRPLMELLLSGTSDTEVPDPMVASLLGFAWGALPVSVSGEKVVFAGKYNSVNFGLQVLAWAMAHRRMAIQTFGEESFGAALEGQSQLATQHLESVGHLGVRSVKNPPPPFAFPVSASPFVLL